MFIKKNTIFCSVLFIASFLFTSKTLGVPLPRNGNDFSNNSNIHTKKDLNSQEHFSLTVKAQITEQIELLKAKKAELLAQQNSSTQLSPEEILSITTYLSIIEQQILDAENHTKSYGKNISYDHWNRADIIAYARGSKRAARKALLDKLMQTNRKMNILTRRIKQYVYTPKTQLQNVPVTTTADSLFALAAGSIIIEKLVVPAATLATGLYVGSGNHDSNNSPIPQTPAPQVATPPANTPTVAPRANVPSANSTSTYSNTKFANPHTKSASFHANAVPKEPARESKKAPQDPFRGSTFKKDPAFSPVNNFSQSDNAQREAVKTFQAQKAHDQARRDQVVETAASVFACGLQQYDQRQKSARKEKVIAEYAREKEEDIQKRMRASGKSRWQIEEEDRLFLERVEQGRKEQARIEQEKQQEERQQEARKKEDKKKEKLDRKSKKPKQKEKDKSNDAQAPGKPTENDGFVPKKNWDGKKIKHRRGFGWPDNQGNVWIPTGPNGHGGPHWDVQHPDGTYDNVVPGGKIRGQK